MQLVETAYPLSYYAVGRDGISFVLFLCYVISVVAVHCCAKTDYDEQSCERWYYNRRHQHDS